MTKTLLDELDPLSKRRLSDIVARTLRKYAAKVKLAKRHFSEQDPYKEQFVLNGKVYWIAVHTDPNNMVTWVIHDPSKKLILA